MLAHHSISSPIWRNTTWWICVSSSRQACALECTPVINSSCDSQKSVVMCGCVSAEPSPCGCGVVASAPSGRTRSDSFSIPRRRFASTALGNARNRVSSMLKEVSSRPANAEKYHGLDEYTAMPYDHRVHAVSAFEKLNERQRAAAEHGAGPLLIIAGAGTGKT